eukprot:TRINITY_DN2986_c0_g1_i2.p1 TRINITY_DN2986_c0_g1~~TRINITY_DN2986_c0_g1_i2.p1  ORF type:complete len:194 (-),score=32.45 TRINITY_DN2986_c0_g1_i2:47-628(-)
MAALFEFVLSGKKFGLVPWENFTDQAERIASILNNHNIWKNLLDFAPHPYTVQDALDWLAFNKSNKEMKDTNWAICEKEGDQFQVIGGFGYKTNKMSNFIHSIELGYYLAESQWGKGIMPEVVKVMTEYAFSDKFASIHGARIERIEAVIYARNKQSERVLLKNGYVLECLKRKAYTKEGVIEDGLAYVKFRE